MSWYSFRPYVPVAQRRAQAARELAKLSKKNGQAASPVLLESRKIAGTFWGKAWCDNLEAYSDYANRLPRGRTYVTVTAPVVHLRSQPGQSDRPCFRIEPLQDRNQNQSPLAPSLWKTIQTEGRAGKIDSLIELLQGKLSSSVMQIVTRPERGLFPTPLEIELDCSCPDWADLCKHVAASLYGVGARLDRSPELLFLLRGVDPADLISQVSAAEAVRPICGRAGGAPALTDKELTDVFGIELADTPAPVQLNGKSHESVDAKNQTPIPTSIPEPKIKPLKKAGRRISSAARAKIAAVARARWEKVKAAADRDKPTVRKMRAPPPEPKSQRRQKARWART